MANPSAVASAIGAQKQFAKQPSSPYQANLQIPSFGNGISYRADQDAARLAQSLGIMSDNLMKLSDDADARDRQQARFLQTLKMMEGKSEEDIKKWNTLQELQNVNGMDLSDNPYAVGVVEQSIGQTLALSARDRYMNENQNTVPKSAEEARKAYLDMIKQTFDSYKDKSRDLFAFTQGFNEVANNGLIAVTQNATEKISIDYRQKGQMALGVKAQNFIINPNLPLSEFQHNMGMLFREGMAYCKSTEEAVKMWAPHLELLAENSNTTERLDALMDMDIYGGQKLKDIVPQFKLRKKIAENWNKDYAQQIITKYGRPDGTVDIAKAQQDINNLDHTYTIPKVNIPVADGDIDNISPTLKEAIPYIGGMLSEMGLGDVAQITSGYRDPERNAAANGSPTSYHLVGDVLDIYVGSMSKDSAEDLQAAFAPFFEEVLYHDSGSGLHLHIAGYRDNIPQTAAKVTDTTASAYSRTRKQDIMDEVKTLNNDRKALIEQEQKNIKDEVVHQCLNAQSDAEIRDIIKNSKIADEATKAKMIREQISLRKAWQGLEAGKTTGDAKLDSYIAYVKSSQYYADIRTRDDYIQRVKEGGYIPIDVKKKAEQAYTRLLRLQRYAEKEARLGMDKVYDPHLDAMVDVKRDGSAAKKPDNVVDLSDDPITIFKENVSEIAQTIPELKAQNLTRQEIEERIIQLVLENNEIDGTNYDPNDVLAELEPVLMGVL